MRIGERHKWIDITSEWERSREHESNVKKYSKELKVDISNVKKDLKELKVNRYINNVYFLFGGWIIEISKLSVIFFLN